jgi:Outer membrane protein beta-barrel domain
MPNFKFAVAFCILLLLMLVLHESVIAQSEVSKIEVGAQISVAGGGNLGDQKGLGGGGRVTFNLTKSLALEGELNYFPSAGFDNVRRFQGQFGVKSGFRFERFGVFGKVRPGFINTKQDFLLFIPAPCPTGMACVQSLLPFPVASSDTGFSLDVGGVAEFYPSKRVIVRLDVGDTIANRQAPPFFIDQPIFGSLAPPVLVDRGFFVVPGSNFTTHNLQISAGVGFRF